MEKGLYLGIDGGQTSTLAALCDEQGHLLGVGHAGPSNHIHEPGGMERMENALSTCTRAAFAQAGWQDNPQDLPELAAVCCGMTGGVEVVAELFPRAARTRKLIAEYDIVTAHAGALAGAPGVIVIAGTGSVAYGVNPLGETARAGGWAYLMGDEGSAYDLGRHALIAAVRMEDGRGPATRLLAAVLAHFQKSTLWEVRTLLYSGQIDRAGIAQLARLVIQAAQEEDPVAVSILQQGAVELSEIVRAVLSRLKMDQEDTPVATIGGLFQGGPTLGNLFAEELHRQAPQARIISPRYQPVIGAVLLALKAGGIEMDEKVEEELKRANQEIGGKEG